MLHLKYCCAVQELETLSSRFFGRECVTIMGMDNSVLSNALTQVLASEQETEEVSWLVSPTLYNGQGFN